MKQLSFVTVITATNPSDCVMSFPHGQVEIQAIGNNVHFQFEDNSMVFPRSLVKRIEVLTVNMLE